LATPRRPGRRRQLRPRPGAAGGGSPPARLDRASPFTTVWTGHELIVFAAAAWQRPAGPRGAGRRHHSASQCHRGRPGRGRARRLPPARGHPWQWPPDRTARFAERGLPQGPAVPLDVLGAETPGVQGGVTLDAAKLRSPELTCADSNSWACGAVVARVAYNDEVTGSSPVTPTSQPCRSTRRFAVVAGPRSRSALAGAARTHDPPPLADQIAPAAHGGSGPPPGTGGRSGPG
jgi:hypothetical protein